MAILWGGILNNCENSYDHGIILVEVTEEYSLIKNLWGNEWGELEFIRLSSENACGLCKDASSTSL